jgi:hypothetical protein
MNKSKSISVTAMFFLITTSFTMMQQASITKRWKAVDLKGRGHDRFVRMNKQQKMEIEFTKDGMFIQYQKGVAKQRLSYQMGDGGKTAYLKIPPNGASMSMKIIKLTGDELAVTSRMYQWDTLYLKAK